MNGKRERIFVFGASGHSKVVIDVIEHQGLYDIAFLVDDNRALKDTVVYSYRVIGGKADLLRSTVRKGIVAIGNNEIRSSIATWLLKHDFEIVSAIHPSAQIARGTEIGTGTVIMAGVVINSDTRIGDNVIINTRASVDHDCTIGDGVHIAPGATLCGAVMVGQGAFICAGATIIPNLSIGRNSLIGAGAVVVRGVPDNVTVIGSPARIICKGESDNDPCR